MMSATPVVLFLCAVVCVQGYIRGDKNIREEEREEEPDSVLSQVLGELQNLRDAGKKHEKKLEENEDTIRQLQDAVKHNEEINRQLQASEKKYEERLSHLEESSQQTASRSTAFMAFMDVGYFLPETYDVIPFNLVRLNYGLQYDPLTSVFTCPAHGLYVFSFSLYSGTVDDGKSASGTLMMDGEIMADVYSRHEDPSSSYSLHHQAATTAVVECPAGSTVWVQNRWDNVQLYGIAFTPRSVFSGYAITFFDHP